ncbi:MAG: U32 family peptidase [Candidatus Omnitrophica bacterium]|nr:U32 family peptidase [Candidatus Omnitrophota bacterium]MDD5690531.1 U32 family peptidase [Candidatus Omnitrophota bacterium]
MAIAKITLTVPTNWQDDLLSAFSDSNIGCVYGKIGGDFIGSGSLLHDLGFKLSKKGISDYIKKIHKQEKTFRYIIDVSCLDNAEWTRAGQKRIRNLLDRLLSFGVDSVSVAMPYLVELIKRQYPKLLVEISLVAEVDNAVRAKRWEDLGADTITLASYKINRNFQLLKEIRNAVKCNLQLTANQCCPSNCIDYGFNANLLSHIKDRERRDNVGIHCASQQDQRDAGFEIISAQWIRPEDIHYYEEIGIDSLQLLDSGIGSKDILRIIDAYSKRLYPGNLAELIPVFLRHTPERIFINNSALDKFIGYFVEGKCLGLCDECAYCKNVVNKLVSADYLYARI